MSFRPFVWRFGAIKALCLLLSLGFSWSSCSAGDNRDRKKAREHSTESIARAIEQQGIQKVYVPDFVETSGKRTDNTALLAAQFSKLLSGRAKKFQVIDRVAVQRTYDDFNVSSADLEKLDVLLRLAAKQGANAILSATVSEAGDARTVEFFLLDCATGKELFRFHHSERVEATGNIWSPATLDTSGRVFYFAGYDGVTMPHCSHCPDPQYTDAARRARITGKVLLAATFTANGTVENIRLLKSLEPSLDRAAANMMQTWRADPAKDADGHPIAVLMPVEMSFELR